MARHMTREEDERVLTGLSMRTAGSMWREIADALGGSVQSWQNKLAGVRTADLKQSGEKPGVVRRGYW